MDSPPDDVIAAVTRLDNKRLGTRSGSSGSRVEVSTTELQEAPAAGELSSVATGDIDLAVSNSQNVAVIAPRLNRQPSSFKPNLLSTNI